MTEPRYEDPVLDGDGNPVVDEQGNTVTELTGDQPETERFRGSRGGVRGSGTGRLAPRSIGEVVSATPEHVDWTVPGLIAPGIVTLLAGRPKVGKSTLLFAIFRAIQDGGMVAGRRAQQARALLLTEERQFSIGEKAELFGLDDDNLMLLMRNEVHGLPWDQIVLELGAYCAENGIKVFAVDTLDKFAGSGGDSENNADDVNRNLSPLIHVAGEHDLAILISAHQRKSSGEHGEAVRGSNALTGAVDVILELERPHGEADDGMRRVLRGTSRMMGTPDRLMLTFDENSGEFTADDYDVAREKADREAILRVLCDEPIPTAEVQERVAIRRQRMLELLHSLAAEGLIRVQKADGSRGAHMYSLPTPGTASGEEI